VSIRSIAKKISGALWRTTSTVRIGRLKLSAQSAPQPPISGRGGCWCFQRGSCSSAAGPKSIGQHQDGDVGTTCGGTPLHGVDHIYFLLHRVNDDEMVIADNQARTPHFRFVSGKGGKSPTTYFLRAPA
jgi:hypothetical protein